MYLTILGKIDAKQQFAILVMKQVDHFCSVLVKRKSRNVRMDPGLDPTAGFFFRVDCYRYC